MTDKDAVVEFYVGSNEETNFRQTRIFIDGTSVTNVITSDDSLFIDASSNSIQPDVTSTLLAQVGKIYDEIDIDYPNISINTIKITITIEIMNHIIAIDMNTIIISATGYIMYTNINPTFKTQWVSETTSLLQVLFDTL